MVQDRYRQIKPAETKPEKAEDDKKGGKVEEKPFEQMTKAEKKAYKARLAKEEGLKKKEAASKEKSGATATAVNDGKPQTTEAASVSHTCFCTSYTKTFVASRIQWQSNLDAG